MMYQSLGAIALLPFLVSAAPSTSKHVLYKRADIDTNAVPAGYDYTKDTWKMYMNTRCSTDDQNKIKQGVAEAGYLANALQQWKPSGAFQNAMDLYMGKDSTSDAFQQRLLDNIKRQWSLHTNDVPDKTTAFIFCDENFRGGEKDCDDGTGAYTFSVDLPDGGEQHIVVMCPNALGKDTSTIADQVSTIRGNTDTAKSLPSLYWNIGTIWFHETFHWENTVTIPQAIDSDPDDEDTPIYGPQGVADSASANGAGVNSVVADAYTMVGSANYLMQTFGLDQAPTPGDISTQAIAKTVAAPDGFSSIDTSNVSTTQDQWVQFAASDAQIDTSKYLPQPTTYPTCDDGDKKCNYISSCGSNWMPLSDFTSDGTSYTGYTTSVQSFCTAADGAIVGAGDYYKAVYNVGFDQGGDPSSNGKAGFLNFEIHNKFTDTHYVTRQNCINALMAMAATGQGCYGPKNIDTKGGTFQIGKDKISYHALGSYKKHDELLVGVASVDDQAQDDPDEDTDDGFIGEKA